MQLSTEEFWSLTLAEFHLLAERRKQHMLREDLRSAILAAIYVNSHRKEGSPEVSVYRFVLDPEAQKSAGVGGKQTWQQQKAIFDAWFAAKFPKKS